MNLWKHFRQAFFDFSEGQQEERKAEKMLRVALPETTSEQEFTTLLHHMLAEDDYLKTEYRWTLLKEQLREHRGERDDWRTAARRLIAYLPKYYGYKSDWGIRRKSLRVDCQACQQFWLSSL